jgi:hypothetical protein
MPGVESETENYNLKESSVLPLALFMTRILADHADHTFAPDDFAISADFLD